MDDPNQEIIRLREKNKELNRRCQELESKLNSLKKVIDGRDTWNSRERQQQAKDSDAMMNIVGRVNNVRR